MEDRLACCSHVSNVLSAYALLHTTHCTASQGHFVTYCMQLYAQDQDANEWTNVSDSIEGVCWGSLSLTDWKQGQCLHDCANGVFIFLEIEANSEHNKQTPSLSYKILYGFTS